MITILDSLKPKIKTITDIPGMPDFVGMSGKLLSIDVDNSIALIDPPSGGSNLLGQQVLTATSNTLQVSGFSIASSESVTLLGNLWSTTGGSIVLTFNNYGPTNEAKIQYAAGYATNGTLNTWQANTDYNTIGGIDANGLSAVHCVVNNVNGRVHCQGKNTRSYGTGHVNCWAMFTTNSYSTITSIKLSCAGGFSSGSSLKIIKNII